MLPCLAAHAKRAISNLLLNHRESTCLQDCIRRICSAWRIALFPPMLLKWSLYSRGITGNAGHSKGLQPSGPAERQWLQHRQSAAGSHHVAVVAEMCLWLPGTPRPVPKTQSYMAWKDRVKHSPSMKSHPLCDNGGHQQGVQ